MTVKLEHRTFEIEISEVISSWLSRKGPIPERWKAETRPTDAMLYNDLQILGTAGCSDLVSRARKPMLRLKSLSNILSELSSAIQTESEAAHRNFEAVSNMCSLIFLPNELLARVFHFIVNGDESLANSTRSKAAVTLSHVSQYFRRTALSCAQLWSSIGGSSDMAISCLSRSKDVPLDVKLQVEFMWSDDIEHYNLVFEQLFINAIPHSKRWRSLDIQFVPSSEADGASSSTVIGGSDVREAFRGIDALSLESLVIRNEKQARLPTFRSYREFEHWSTPALRHVTSVNYFPLSLPGLANVTTLEITLRLGEIRTVDILQDLSRMKALEDVILKLEYGSRTTDPDHPRTRIELQNVRRLRIETGQHDWYFESLTSSLFRSLFFPGARSLDIKLSGIAEKPYPEDCENDAVLKLTKQLRCIFQHVEQFALLEQLNLEASIEHYGEIDSYDWVESQRGYILLVAPINMLPSLKHFTMCSNRKIFIALKRKKDTEHSVYVPPPLETITVKIPEIAFWGIARFVQDVLQKQEEGGEWARFHELVVIEDNESDTEQRKSVAKTFAGDAALEWCEGPFKIIIDPFYSTF